MYKFTNGIVVFDEKTRDDYLKAGYKLAENKPVVKEPEAIKIEKEANEDSSNDGTIEEEPRRSQKKSK